MVIEGKLHAKFDAQQVSDTFKKRDFVVEYISNPLYPQYVTFQVTQDRCATLDSFHKGDKIEVTFNLRGREYADRATGEMKYFNTLEAWRIQPVTESEGEQKESPVHNMASDSADDLPF